MKSNLKLIAGDASDRKFYRELSAEGKSMGICMQFPKWEGGYGGDPLSWLGMQSALVEMSVPVPEVYKIDEKECLIWTEDLGDHCLGSDLKTEILDIRNSECKKIIEYYKDALKLIVQAQYAKVSAKHPAYNRFFDFEKLYYEMTFFIKNFTNGFLNLNISEDTHPELYTDFKKLCQKLDNCERFFCHRDYHSRNIMVKNEKIYWIDFQDARIGPHSYDVVSLLRDSYVEITWETRKKLFEFYLKELNQKRTSLNLIPISESEFYNEALLMGLQRNIKAIGSFGYLATQKHKSDYLKYVFPTLNTICSGEAILYPEENLNLIAEFPYLFKLLLNLQSGELTDKLEKKINAAK